MKISVFHISTDMKISEHTHVCIYIYIYILYILCYIIEDIIYYITHYIYSVILYNGSVPEILFNLVLYNPKNYTYQPRPSNKHEFSECQTSDYFNFQCPTVLTSRKSINLSCFYNIIIFPF